MRLVMLTTNMARGGAETLVARLSIQLRRRGWDVQVVSLIRPSAFEAQLAEAGVPLHAPGLAGLAVLLRHLRPAILHCHMFHANVAGRLLSSVLPFGAVISTLHSTAETGRTSTSIWRRDIMYRATECLSDTTVAVSDAVAARHLQAGAVRRVSVIPNGVDTGLFRFDMSRRCALRDALGLASEFVWLAVGRLMWKKNFEALLRAFPDRAGSVLLIAGSGLDEKRLKSMAGRNVRFLGDRNDVPALMNAADAFVLSSVVEGMPLVLLEAGASELPCVATNVGGVTETGIGIAIAPDELRSALEHVVSISEEQRRELGRAARERVVSRYSLEVVTAEWETLYHRLTST